MLSAFLRNTALLLLRHKGWCSDACLGGIEGGPCPVRKARRWLLMTAVKCGLPPMLRRWDSPLRICRPEAQSDWPSHGLSTPRRLRSDRSGTSQTQSPPCAGGSPWPWPKASRDVRVAQPTSAGLRTIPARDAVVGKARGEPVERVFPPRDWGPGLCRKGERNLLG